MSTKIKVADYIAKRVAETGVKHVFMISGGGAMHLNEAFGSVPELQYVCNHHEQASAMAVEGYARTNYNLGVACVTTGPGGLNTLNGVFGLYADSIPGLFISGQVKYTTTVPSTGLPLRQFGDQEAPIVDVVKPITKYAHMVTDASTIRYHLEKAIWLAKHDRPGPTWLDIPLNIQASMVDPDTLKGYDPEEDRIKFDEAKVRAQVTDILRRLEAAERPVLWAGGGVRASGSYDLFRELIERLNVPVATATGAHDLLETDHPLFVGRPGITADRGSNFVIQNCDLVAGIGTRMWVRLVSYSFDAFAREAYKIAVDIDQAELKKPTIKLDMPVHSELKFFLEEVKRQLGSRALSRKTDWLAWCKERRRRYPAILPEHAQQKKYVNSFHFVDVLGNLLGTSGSSTPMGSDEMVVTGNGTANQCTFQAMHLKPGVRLMGNAGCASMGYDLPAAIGACFARGKKRTVCIAGDGSLQMNIQELQTVKHHGLPIKIIVLNNEGYLAIRATQEAYFNSHYVATGPSSGVTCPDFVKVAEAYGIPAARCESHADLEEKMRTALDSPGPYLLELMMDPKQTLYPKLSSEVKPDGTMVSKPLEDMFPFLSREEFAENMIVKPWNP